jgi:hypothetical protein
MASLKSIIEGGSFGALHPDNPYYMKLSVRVASRTLKALQSRDTILVRAQSVWDDLVPFREGDPVSTSDIERMTDFRGIPRPAPPYRKMWLEAMALYGRRWGALVERMDKDESGWDEPEFAAVGTTDAQQAIRQARPQMIVGGSIWYGQPAPAVNNGSFFYGIAADGSFLPFEQLAHGLRDDESEEERLGNRIRLLMVESWVLHTLARMNCANTELVPISNGHSHQRRDRPPSSVWHEIRVTSVPKLRAKYNSTAPEGESRAVRFHWVRGHFADYSKGAGLFGNPKLRAVFWIPEHRAGSEELGTVVANYAVG